MDLYEAMENIRTDAGKGKKCPGGYSIPAGKKCRGAATGIVGTAAKRAKNLGKVTKNTLLDPKNRVRVSLGAAGLAAYALNDYKLNKKLKEVRGVREQARRAGGGTKAAPGQSRQQPVDARAEKAKAAKDRNAEFVRKFNQRLNEGRKQYEEQARRAGGGTKAAPGQSRRQPVDARAEKAKAENDRDAEFMREFNLGSDFTEKDLRRAKVAAARKYHPDVNPEGGQKMASMNAAVDRLAKRARKDSFGDDMFFDLYPRWDSGTGSWSRGYGCY